MIRKLLEVIPTEHGAYKILTGRAGPSCHCICPAARNSLVLPLLGELPPRM